MMHFINIFYNFLIAFILLIAAGGLGSVFFIKSGCKDCFDVWGQRSLELLAGCALGGILFSFLFMWKLNLAVTGSVVIPLALYQGGRLFCQIKRGEFSFLIRNHYGSYIFIVLFTILLLLVMTAPPTAGDVLNYHFDIPQRWVLAQKLYFTADHPYAGLPSLMHAWFAIAILLKADTVPVLMIYTMQFAFCIILYHLAVETFDQKAGWLAILIYVLSPLGLLVSTSAFVDAPTEIFAGTSFLLFCASTKYKNFILLLSAFFLGSAIATKTNALILCPVWGLWMLLQITHLKGFWRTMAWGIGCGIIVFIVSGGIYLRTYIWAGNPFYPTMPSWSYALFPDVKYQAAIAKFTARSWYENLSVWWTITMCPERLLGNSTTKIFMLFSPLGLAFIPAGIIVPSEKRRTMTALFLILITTYLIIAFSGGSEIRFFYIMEGVAAFAAGGAATLLWRSHSGKVIVGLGIAMLAVISICYLLVCDAKTVKYHCGLESKAAYLRNNTSYYDVWQYINENIPHNSTVATCLGNSYYLKCRQIRISWWTLFPYLTYTSLNDWESAFVREHCDYVLINRFESENRNKAKFSLYEYLQKNGTVIRKFDDWRQGRWGNYSGRSQECIVLYQLKK